MKNRLVKQNMYLITLNEENSSKNTSNSPKGNLITILKDSNSSLKNYYNFKQTYEDFNKNKYNSPYNSQSKSIKFNKTLSDNNSFPKKFDLEIKPTKIFPNKTINNFPKTKQIFPYINKMKSDYKHNQNLLKSQYFYYKSKYNEFKSKIKRNDKLENIKVVFNKNENNKTEFLSKNNKNLDENNKYKYSSIIRNLDIWDKEHCFENKSQKKTDLFTILYDYFEKQELKSKMNDLIYASNILTTRDENSYDIFENKQHSKEFMEMMKKRKKETTTILKNNLYKTQLKFSELFDKKYSKEFDENLDIDPDTFNMLLEDELKSMFYNQIIKDRKKYEKQLHDDLSKINSIIYKRKISKDKKTSELKELYAESVKLKKEYNDKYAKNRNIYWARYDSYEHYYKSLIDNGNINAVNDLRKSGEYEHTLESQRRISIKDESIEEKVTYKSPNLRKRRASIGDKNTLSVFKNAIKRLEDEKKFKLLHMNNEMNSKLREIEHKYLDKIERINNEQKVLENDIKIIKLELNYYKEINDELIREHKVYYMNKLKKGYDCRKEGLMWIVYNLLELQVPLEYHHFPKYLTHEQIDYLKKYAKVQLKQDELKLIINALKKKQSTQKMKEVLKCMDAIDNILDYDNNYIMESNEDNEFTKRNFLMTKIKIDKKFMKIYQENIDIMKNYLFKNIESYEFNKIINEFKKDIYHGSNSDINKSKRDLLNVFMGDKNNKYFFQFLVDIKANYQRLEDEKEKLFEKEKENFFKLVESNMNHKASIDNVIKNEMIKRCLFGTRLEQ